MAEAAVLFGGYIKRIIGFTDTGFNHKSGFLVKFTFKGTSYVHVNSINFRSEDQTNIHATAGYYDEDKFLKYKAKEIPLEELPKHILNKDGIDNGIIDDIINVRKLKVIEPFTDFCKVYDISWVYTGVAILDSESNIIIPPPPTSTVVTTNVPVHEVSRAFYQHNIPLASNPNIPSEQRASAAYIIAKIALQINNIQKDIFPLFESDDEFTSYINSQNIEWRTGNIFLNPYIKELQIYLNRITEFYNSLYANQIAIRGAKPAEKLYWLAYVLSENALTIVPSYDKIKILNVIAKGDILGELSKFIPMVINEEELVLKIAFSVTTAQSTEFLLGLTDSIFFDEKKTSFGSIEILKVTLFQMLYEKIDDSKLKFGNENLQKLMDKLYALWIQSDYYPYNIDNTVKDNEVNSVIYETKPIDLAYESGSVAYVFNTSNYDFVFDSYEILVYKLRDIRVEQYVDVIGKYKIFQPITIKNTDTNNHTKFLSVNIEGNEKAVLPIFYLKYLDDKKETDNLLTAAELTFDVALTLSGIGNIRHIRHVWKLGRVALGLEVATGGEILMRYELAIGVAGVIEVTGSVGDIIIHYLKDYQNTYCDISSPSYNKALCDQYTTLDNIFTVMQLGGGALDFASSMLLRNSARSFLNGPIPDGFSEDVLVIIRKFAGDFSEIKEVFRVRLVNFYGDNSAIWVKLNGFDIAKQEEFLLDFERAGRDVLDDLNVNNGELIGYWRRSEDKILRPKISFLENLKFIFNSSEMNEEIFIGIVRKEPTEIIGQYEWFAKGGHHFDSLVESGFSGKVEIIGNTEIVGPSHLGYYKAKVRVFDIDFPSADKFKVKKKKSTFFPNHWTREKVQDELARAYDNKVFQGGNQYLGTMSDGINVMFHIDNGIIQSAYPSIK